MTGDGEDRRVGRRPRVLKAVGLTLAGTLVLGCAAAGWAYWHLNSNIKSVDINSALGDDRPAKVTPTPSTSQEAPLPTEAVNILVLGSDSRSGKENQALGGGSSTGARSDTAMVVHIGAGRTTATVVSIPRDTLVTRPSCPLESGGTTSAAYGAMFNSAYSVGGPVCAVKTVESITNVRMDHYVEIDFSGFAKLVDALGGVTVTTDEDIDDDDSHLTLKAGTHHLNGKQALAFARTRHGIGDGSDLGRIGLQQKLVKALLEQISSTNLLTSPTKLYSVADAITGSLTTDTGLDSLTELMSLGESLKGLSSDEVKTVTMPVVTAPSNPNRVVAKEPAASDLWESLR
ncbi:LCP family protein [Streptomyces canus]|uniref:LCP family protein required for cell wall assembly n=1 Tax=Streptomyces canus TaxID=58343 RepID=A0AAW8FHG1_9ACTN|nr:LCP family protein [Streptomyces canus]MDQ0763288.1 LCP family protein required for cell wall assembly [Streptomyces canus]MDQ0908258.1 LCP family protein required for cell wall assembly [Streptomyces canus]